MPTLHHWHRSCEEASQATSWNAEQEALSTVDVLTAFAAFTETSAGQTCRPTVLPLASKSGRGAMLDLRGLWHPCAVPGGGAGGCIVANDLVMGARCAAPHLKSLLYSKVLPTEIQHVRILVDKGLLYRCRDADSARTLLLTGPNMGGLPSTPSMDVKFEL